VSRAAAAIATALLLVWPALADDGAVAAAFERYRASLLARDGEAAAAAVTEGSHAYYERLKELALRAPREEVAALPLADRLAVLRLRHEFTAQELAPLSGAELIAISVEESWSSPRTLQKLAVTGVEQEGAEAVALVTPSADTTPIRFRFVAEPGGGWRLDLEDLARASEPALAEALATYTERTGLPPEEVPIRTIEETSGHLVEKDLWQPLAG
jgi:hypothetical protein